MLSFRKQHLRAFCQVCGSDKLSLVLHHIDRNRKNNDPGNLRTLCRKCHLQEHSEDEKPMRTVNSTHASIKPVPVNAGAIRRARRALNETQEQFAARFGILQSTLSRWEAGQLPKGGAGMKMLEIVLADIARVHPF